MDAKSFQELKNRSIFARLKKLFSDEAVIRNIGGKKLKIADIHNYGYATDRNSLRDRFNRLRTSSSDSYSRDFNLAFQRNRTELFRDYDSMDMDPIVHSVLDIYADECTTLNETGDLIKVYSANEEIHDILDNLFNDILNVRFNLWSWARSLCKYGDFYLRLFISPEYGIYSIKPYSTYNVTRIENSDLSNKNYVKFQVTIPEGNRMEELENYEMIHFRLLSDSNFLPNGLSICEGARRCFKQLCLLEDSLLISQIMRAPEKRIFKIDVGNAPQNEIENLMERAMNQIQKVPYMDANGEYNLRFNMMNMMQDFFIPVRGGNSGNSIETLKGLEWHGGTEATEYVKNKMLAAFHVPKAFLGFDESLSGKASLSAEDIRFCRSIQRVQKFLLSGLTEIAIIHLYSLGYRDESLLEFSLEMTNPSTVFEKEKLEIFKNKSDLCQSLQEQKLFSKKWMYQNIFGMSDQDIIELNKQLIDDSKTNFRFSQIENEGSDPYLKFLKTQHGSSSSSENNSEEGGMEGSSGGSFGGLGDTDFNTDDLFGNENEPENDTENNSEKETNKSEKPVTEQWKSPYNKHKNHNKMVKKEWDKKRDQTGRKDASKYPRGEDPLGDRENRAKVNLKESSNKNILNEDIDKNSLKYKIFDENTIDLLNQDIKKSYMDIK